jgi:hypothetical protein
MENIMPPILRDTTSSKRYRELGTIDTPVRGRKARVTDTPDFTKAEVAGLSIKDIQRMSRNELTAAIRAADVALFRDDVAERLEYLDRSTLEQLAFLARRTVRNQGY